MMRGQLHAMDTVRTARSQRYSTRWTYGGATYRGSQHASLSSLRARSIPVHPGASILSRGGPPASGDHRQHRWSDHGPFVGPHLRSFDSNDEEVSAQ
jgi:hypothetical protein